jgi:HK97 family phage prohead protease
MTSPILDVCRTASFTFARAEGESAGDGLTIEGYAAVFGVKTDVNSWEGVFTEEIRKGAFRKTLRERTPVMQFDHGRHPVVGSIPIGKYETVREDDQGLYVSGRLVDNWLVQPVRDAIANESITGMSFRFGVVREEWRDNKGVLLSDEEVGMLLWDPGKRGPLARTLVEVKMPEAGPVVFPQYTETSVSVRARDAAILVSRDPELRRQVVRSLALSEDITATEIPEDDQLRHEVARALLFPPKTPQAAPPPRHPDLETARDDEQAPAVAPEPPAPKKDAPPTGAPVSDSDRRRQIARRNYVTSHGVGKRY